VNSLRASWIAASLPRGFNRQLMLPALREM
jgi:hypothetical protein